MKLKRPSDDYPDYNVFVLFGDFEDSGDGINVNFTEDGFAVTVNKKAASFIAERGIFGTRYGADAKITFYIDGRPQD